MQSPYTITAASCAGRGSRPGRVPMRKAHTSVRSGALNGPDVSGNVLCLCPNCHVLFDQGAITIEDDFTLLGRTRRLSLHPQHSIDVLHLRYHREHYGG